MELSPRKQAVLAAVAKAYLETGVPIGSKALTGLLKNAPSSATLRNEMSELCEIGLLEQPHTSAGRIPTAGGLKLYVNELMPHEPVAEGLRSRIDKEIDWSHYAPEKIISAAGELLTELTGLPAIVCFEANGSPRIRSVELFPVSRRAVMLLLVTADGRTRSTVLRLKTDYTPQLSEDFARIAKHRICGKRTDELTRGILQGIAASAGENAFLLMPLLSELAAAAEGIEASEARLFGKESLRSVCSDGAALRRITALVEQRKPLLELTSALKNGVGTFFGSDTGFREFKRLNLIAASYYGSDRFKGAIGVIGPNRMSYGQIIPGVEYIAARLNDVMTAAQKDMED